jgi:hypothetical protein
MLKKIISLSEPNSIFPQNIDEETDIKITQNILKEALEVIAAHPFFTSLQKQELQNILQLTFSKALPKFIKARNANYVFHNPQVALNIIKICSQEKIPYSEFKNAMLLGLLHDIGNSEVKAKKVLRSMIKAELAKNNNEKALKLAQNAINFRLEHMLKAEPLLKEITSELTEQNLLSAEDLDLIINTVKIHDNPSIAGTINEMKKIGITLPYTEKDYLFSFPNTPLGKFSALIREADTLFTLTPHGILSDLIKEKSQISPQTIKAKLQYNINKFQEEYELYKNNDKADDQFIKQTIFRTQGGYALFSQMKSEKNLLAQIQSLNKNFCNF